VRFEEHHRRGWRTARYAKAGSCGQILTCHVGHMCLVPQDVLYTGLPAPVGTLVGGKGKEGGENRAASKRGTKREEEKQWPRFYCMSCFGCSSYILTHPVVLRYLGLLYKSSVMLSTKIHHQTPGLFVLLPFHCSWYP
jgi:hypothetical protein